MCTGCGMSIFAPGEAMTREAFGYASRTVDYCRDGAAIASGIPAKLGRTLFRYDDPAGMIIRTEQRDFILRYSDLNTEPKTGDEIVLDGQTYVVSAPNGEPCWRWHSRSSHTEIRIHAKFAGDFEPPAPESVSGNTEG